MPAPLNLITEPLHFLLKVVGLNLKRATSAVTAYSSTDNTEENEQLQKLYRTLTERHLLRRKLSTDVVSA